MDTAIGVDIGGSHVSSAAVNLNTYEIKPGTYFSGPVNNKASKEEIFKGWARVINQSIQNDSCRKPKGIGIAMPGPFQYKEGVALFDINDKYEALYQVSVKDELPDYLEGNAGIRFINDATAFGVGSSLRKGIEGAGNVISITLGTGFGAAFLHNHQPIVHSHTVPDDGCLWNKLFKDGIADDYFSTRWFLQRYEYYTGQNSMKGVKEIVDRDDKYTHKVFHEFALNLSAFMLTHANKFKADLLIIGGNIAKSHHLFLPVLKEEWKKEQFTVPVIIVEETDKSGIIGSSMLAKEAYWKKIKDNLPTI